MPLIAFADNIYIDYGNYRYIIKDSNAIYNSVVRITTRKVQ
jgi:hypothetical protein